MTTMPYIFDDEVRDGETVRVPLHMMDAMQRAVATHDFNARANTGLKNNPVQDARTAARARWIKQLSDAWRRPQRDMNPGGGFTCPECHGTGRDPDGDSPDGRCDECGGTGHVEQPNNNSSAQRSDPGPSPDPNLRVGQGDAATARRAAYDAYCQRLRDAWRGTEKLGRPNFSDAGEPDAGNQLLGRHLSAEPVANARGARESSYEEYRRRLGSAWQQGRTDPGSATAIEKQAEQWRHGK
jgi:hypothetical protein